jgi:acyl-CoA thioesterase I
MIIMRRIIISIAILALTSCGGERAPSPGEGGGWPGAAEGSGWGATEGAGSGDARGNGSGAARDDGAGAARGDGAGAAPSDGSAARGAERAAARTVVFVGTSLTAGYGVGEDAAYPALIQRRIDDASLPFRVVNAGISGETSAGGLRRIDWSLQQPVDVLVVELGANDGLRGLDPGAMRSNLDAILTRARDRYPDVALVLIGMEAPPNLGTAYVTRFRRVFSDLAREHDAALVPFLLEDVAGEAALNIEDGIHPNPAGHRILAATVWDVLGPLLRQRAAQAAGSAPGR